MNKFKYKYNRHAATIFSEEQRCFLEDFYVQNNSKAPRSHSHERLGVLANNVQANNSYRNINVIFIIKGLQT